MKTQPVKKIVKEGLPKSKIASEEMPKAKKGKQSQGEEKDSMLTE
jgi:hypothetical protein